MVTRRSPTRLIHAQHHRGFRRVQVEPDHVVGLVHEQRVVGQFEPVGQVRFEAEPFPDPADGGLRQSAAFGHLLPGPMGGMLSSGVDSSVATTTSSTCSAVIVGLRPDRGSSTKPSNRDSTNLDRHLPTVGIETPSCAATSLFVKPVAQARTIRERNAKACAEFLRRTHRSSCSVSPAVNSSTAFGRPVIPKFYPLTTKLRRRTLAA